MSRYLAERYQGVSPYVPGEQPGPGFVKLNANETTMPPSPRVREALSDALVESLGLYADPHARPLKAAVARALGVDEEAVFVGNGSDEVLGFLFLTTFEEGDALGFPDISYGFYRDYAATFGLAGSPVPLRDDFTLDIEGFRQFKGAVVFANPNAPTGLAVSPDDVRRIAEADPDRLVVVDEAYIDYGAETCVPLVRECPNVVVVQTFSKSRNLAGAHIGFAIGAPELIGNMEDIRFSFNPFSVSALTQAVGAAAVEDKDYLRQCVAQVTRERARLADALAQRGFQVLPSQTNFLFVHHPAFKGGELCDQLRRRAVLIRHFDQPRIRDWNRITVGTAQENDALLAALDDALGEAIGVH